LNCRHRGSFTNAGRRRSIDAEATRLHTYFHTEQMRQPAPVEHAMGVALPGLVRQLDAICDALAELETFIDAAFLAHPDGRIISSVPGLGVALGARLLAEIGDDHSRFADGRGLKAFAGAAPVTRASGRSTFVHARRAKNNRMAAVGYVWALAAVRHDPHWEARYRARRAAGDRHVSALRKMFNSMLGKLHHCLSTGELYQADEAFRSPHPPWLHPLLDSLGW
jgi:transposase